MSVDVFQALCKEDCLFVSCKAVVNCIVAYVKCAIKFHGILIPVRILEVVIRLDRAIFAICTVKNITGWSKDIDAINVLIRIQKILAGAFECLGHPEIFIGIRW